SVAATVVDARRDRHVAAEIAGEAHPEHARVDRTQAVDDRERSVAAAVVDEDELPVVVAELVHDGVHFIVKPLQVLALVEHRDDDRQQRSHPRVPAAAASTPSTTRDWSSAASAAKIGMKIERAETASVIGSVVSPSRSR